MCKTQVLTDRVRDKWISSQQSHSWRNIYDLKLTNIKYKLNNKMLLWKQFFAFIYIFYKYSNES